MAYAFNNTSDKLAFGGGTPVRKQTSPSNRHEINNDEKVISNPEVVN
jgi:hypothetical protein